MTSAITHDVFFDCLLIKTDTNEALINPIFN